MANWDTFPLADTVPAGNDPWAAFPVATPSAPVTAKGLYGALDTGLRAATAGIGGALGDITDLGAAGIGAATNYIERKLGLPETVAPDRSQSILNKIPTYQSMQAELERQYGPAHKAQNIPEEYVQRLGEFAPMLAGGVASIPARIARTVAPAVTSKTAGLAAREVAPAAEPYADVAGAFLSPAIATTARRLATPFPSTSPGRQALVGTLEAEGVIPTAGQRSGSKALQYSESTLGDFPGAGGAATRAQEAQQAAFTSAALRRIGQATEPTPANVNQAVQNIQNEFTRLSTSNVLRYDNQFANDLTQTMQRYNRKLPSQQREVIGNFLVDFSQYPGQMPGTVYQVARSDLSRMAHAARNTDPTYSDALRGLRNALDNAMRRSISPADRAAWDTARARWGNWRTLERTAKETDAAGNVKITPAALKAAAAARDAGGFARGQGAFNELARAGSEILRPLPQSGTAPRAVVASLITALGAGLGGLPGVAAIAATPIAGRALMSGPVQRYLANQRFQPPNPAEAARLRRLLLGTSLLPQLGAP